jgi:hypothetical protein
VPLIAGGNWTLKTPPALSMTFQLPPPVQLTDGVPATIDRSADRQVAWNGAAYDATTTANLSLQASNQSSPILTCSAPAQSGSLTIPTNLLGQFPSGASGVLSIAVTETGAGIPHGNIQFAGGAFVLVNWTSSDARPVDFK